MRAALALLFLAGCSYDWDSVQSYYLRDGGDDGATAPGDPRHVRIDPFTCNPVSSDGCVEPLSCGGKIENNQSISSLMCHGAIGSGTQGVFCDGASNCLPGLLCWTDPRDTTNTQHTCEAPCFDDSDCRSGCDTTGDYAVHYGRATMYRCF